MLIYKNVSILSFFIELARTLLSYFTRKQKQATQDDIIEFRDAVGRGDADAVSKKLSEL